MFNFPATASGRLFHGLGPGRGRGCEPAIALVAQTRRVPPRLLTHRSRCRLSTVRARQLAMYLSHVVLGCSFKEIGYAFGRDRSTVAYACGLIEDMRDDPRFDAEVSGLELQLEALGYGGEAANAH